MILSKNNNMRRTTKDLSKEQLAEIYDAKAHRYENYRFLAATFEIMQLAVFSNWIIFNLFSQRTDLPHLALASICASASVKGCDLIHDHFLNEVANFRGQACRLNPEKYSPRPTMTIDYTSN